MRINPYFQVQQMYNTKKAGGARKTENAGHVADGVMISDIGKEIQTAKQAVEAAPDIRTDITEPIRAAVNSGTYEVSSEKFADKLLRAAGEI